MGVLKKLASETALYGVSTILGRLFNYVLVPIHTSLFLPSQLAVQVELYAYAGVAFTIYTYGMETTYFRFANASDNKQNYYNLIQSAIITSSLIMSGLLILLATPLTELMGFSGEQTVFVWMAVIMATDAIVAIPFARLRLEKQAKRFVAAKLVNIGLNVGLNFFFLYFCRDVNSGKYLPEIKPLVDTFYRPEIAPRYIVLANLVANLVFFWMLRRQFTHFKFVFNAQLFKPVWQYAYPILIMSLAGVTNMMSDRMFLRYLLPEGFYPGRSSEDALGIYGNCYKLSIFMNLAIQAFKYAAEPFFFSKAEDKNAPLLFARVMQWFIIVCIVIWLAVSLNLDLLGLILRRPIYREGLAVVPILLLAFLFLGIYYNLTTWFKLTNKTRYGTFITLAGATCNVLLNFLLVPQLGYMGSALTFMFSSFLMVALCYWLGQKYYPVPYNVASAVFYVLSAGLLIYLAYPIKSANFWLSFTYHSALLGLYFLVILVIERDAIPLKIKQKIKILG